MMQQEEIAASSPSKRSPRYTQRGVRPELEQFFTPFWAAERLVEEFFPDLGANDYVADLGTGLGAFLAAIPQSVPAVGVELDPELAERARMMTGREVICGDFRTVALPRTPTAIIGNPPFKRPIRDAYLETAYNLLPENGRCGVILPANAISFAGPVEKLRSRWSIEQTLLPRQIFPRAKFPFLFVLFTKERARTMRGFFLFDEAREVGRAPKAVRLVLMNGRPHRSVWRALIEDAIDAHRGAATREQVRAYIEPRKTSENPMWKDRIRAIINDRTAFTEDEFGVVRKAA